MKQFRLLRSNKESGPYSAEQLIQMGFKPYDLIWEEGRSAAWRYPSEIDALKAFSAGIEEQPYDRFYKKPSPTTINEKTNNNILSVSNKHIPVNNTDAQALSETIIKQKPRIKIRPDWNKIEPIVSPMQNELTQMKPENQILYSQTTSKEIHTWKDAWLDWEQEKKAATSVSKSQERPLKIKEDTTIQTKFSQSLDDIKEQYVEHVLKAKNQKTGFSWNRYKAYFSLALIGLPLIGFGIWLGLKLNNRNINADAIIKSQQEKLQNITPSKSVAIEKENSANINNGTIAVEDEVGQPEKLNKVEKQVKPVPVQLIPKKIVQNKPQQPIQKKVTGQAQNQPSFDDNHHSILQNNPNTNPSRVANRRMSQADVSSLPTENNTVATNPSVNTNNPGTVRRKMPKIENINDYVSVNEISQTSQAGGQRVTFQVQNISNIYVDMIVMDLQYFDANGRFNKGETVYIRNIPANETVNIKAPENKYSAKLTYKVSMVSAEQKGVYLIAD